MKNLSKKSLFAKSFWCLVVLLSYVFCGTMISVYSGHLPLLDVCRFLVTCLGLIIIIFSLKYLIINKTRILFLLVSFILFTTFPTISSQLETNSFANGMLCYTDSIMWIAIFFICYRIGYNRGDMVDQSKYLVCLVPVFLYLFWQVKSFFMLDSTDDIAMISSAYYPLFLFPFVTLIKNRSIQWFLMFLIFITVLLSVKRTGILVFAFLVCIYYYYKYVSNASIVKKIRYIFLSFFVALFLLFLFFILVDKMDIGIIDRLKNMGEDGGSGRDEIWAITIKMIGQSDIISFLFGHGFNMVSRHSPAGLSAHCDYLEIIYDYGIIGTLIYITFYVKLFIYYRFVKKYNPDWQLPMILSFFLVFVFSLTSHLLIYPTYFLFLCVLWGLIAGHCDNKKNYSNEFSN